MTGPPPADLVAIRYGEIFLKGGNRRMFIEALRRDLQRVTARTGWKVGGIHGRFFLRLDPTSPAPPVAIDRVIERVTHVFGVVSASPAVETSSDLEEVKATAAALARATVPTGARTFRVRTRRADKSLPFTSTEANREIGSAVWHAIGLDVDLKRPDFDVAVELGEVSFVFTESVRGPGGLPVGVSGRVALLLSGGIDSPVAGWMAMKRGCSLEAIYFHSFPLIGDAAREKVRDLVKVLASWAGGAAIRLHVVPFADAQKTVRDHADPRLYVLLYRRLMVRIAERIGRQARCGALVTGDSLGQVASQTLENLAVISEVATLPILRPLVGLDKVEAIERAQSIGTFDISTLPHEDCCSLFVPKHPETRGRSDRLRSAEARLSPSVDELVRAAVEGTEVEELRAR